MKSLIVCTLVLACTAAVNGQNNGGYQHDTSGDQGVEYVHNPEWDLTPFERYKLKKAAELERSSGPDLAAVQASRANAPRPNQIPTSAAAVLPKRVKAVRRPAAPAVQAPRTNQPSFQNFQARNTFSQPPRPQAVAIPRPAPRPVAPRQQAAPQQLGLLQQSAGAAYTQTAVFGQQQQPLRQQHLAVFQAAPTAAPRRPAPAAPVQFRAVPAVRATPAPAPAVPAAIQSPQFIAQNTQHPDPNFWNRAYEYQAPSYAAKAAGSSYTYVANL